MGVDLDDVAGAEHGSDAVEAHYVWRGLEAPHPVDREHRASSLALASSEKTDAVGVNSDRSALETAHGDVAQISARDRRASRSHRTRGSE